MKKVFLSNTSSIPIHELNHAAELKGSVIGFHFYNPPAVQRLIEIISFPQTSPNLVQLATELAQRLKKSSFIPGMSQDLLEMVILFVKSLLLVTK
ncbi:MAG: hypothetical protein HWD61_07835 [Parachlamydiaceae bacterium]|nr:MAG: hypothetical protein HWD61_07835 [Parachlamydiaceae bacterium]